MPLSFAWIWKKVKEKLTRSGRSQTRKSNAGADEAQAAAQVDIAASSAPSRRASTIWTLDSPSADWTPNQSDEHQVDIPFGFLANIRPANALVTTTDLNDLLPVEILSAIFELAAQAHHNVPAVVMFVSKYWRTVALTHKPLWSYLWLDYRSPKEKYLRWNERLGGLNMPRSITIVALAREQTLTEDWRYLEKELQSLERGHTIKSFNFYGNFETFDWCVSKMRLDTFEEINLQVDWWPWDGRKPPSPHGPFGILDGYWPQSVNAKPIRTISLSHLGISFRSLDLSELTTLEIFDADQLTFPEPSIIMPALKTMPRLETLVLEYTGLYGTSHKYNEYGIIRLAHLRQLQINGGWPKFYFLGALELPNLESLAVDSASEVVFRILSKFGAPLRRICCASYRVVDPNILLEQLGAYPSLTSVYLLDSADSTIATRFAARRMADPGFLPLLKCFESCNELSWTDCLSPPLDSTDVAAIPAKYCRWQDAHWREVMEIMFALVMQRTTLPLTRTSSMFSAEWKTEIKSRYKPRQRSSK
ncbi:hypothetical protein SISSUDRAFT_1045659 [Sistotremastrum suecicum HHB10207 ss-3]|uniref:Uncharacterized protein n=1 Tax=Sistotremastrum suecicum HHB10207 ss-3 TaxID=1314776 RepID=A0A166EA47_9AGAM|nr:hypothetical protein SISSUDRAFT_1045659 [Sistotremastrum suecicum HHB10207 ss-3]